LQHYFLLNRKIRNKVLKVIHICSKNRNFFRTKKKQVEMNNMQGVEPFICGLQLEIEKPFYSVEYVNSFRDWLKNNLNNLFMIPIVYIVLVLAGRHYMKDKPKYELRLPLIVWNIILALFSILGTTRFLPGM
jgi:hypothetical protein